MGDTDSHPHQARQIHPHLCRLQVHPELGTPAKRHLLHSLGEGKVFTKLDLAQSYQQLPVDDATAEAQMIMTHRGAFKCRRLQFGVSVAPGIFQSLMG